MRTLIIISALLLASCQKDTTCHCTEAQNGTTIKEYDAFEYKGKGVMNPQDDECGKYVDDNHASVVAGKQNYEFYCVGIRK